MKKKDKEAKMETDAGDARKRHHQLDFENREDAINGAAGKINMVNVILTNDFQVALRTGYYGVPVPDTDSCEMGSQTSAAKQNQMRLKRSAEEEPTQPQLSALSHRMRLLGLVFADGLSLTKLGTRSFGMPRKAC